MTQRTCDNSDHLPGCVCSPPDAKPMTAEERARKIAFGFSGRDFQVMDEGRIRELLIDRIAEQIKQACDEARAEAHAQWHHPNAAYAKGFAEARAGIVASYDMRCLEHSDIEYKRGFADCREKAAKVCESHLEVQFHDDTSCDCPQWCANHIRALTPGEGTSK